MKFNDFEGVKNISGERIHQARTAQRMTQLELAAKMQVEGVVIEREAISKIETGGRLVTDYELAAFAKVLRVSMDWLIESE
jgi:transcriptional regulator with XRE-family HTH domain